MDNSNQIMNIWIYDRTLLLVFEYSVMCGVNRHVRNNPVIDWR